MTVITNELDLPTYLKVLGEPCFFDILDVLRDEPMSVNELARRLGGTPVLSPTISGRLRRLRQMGFVSYRSADCESGPQHLHIYSVNHALIDTVLESTRSRLVPDERATA